MRTKRNMFDRIEEISNTQHQQIASAEKKLKATVRLKIKSYTKCLANNS